MGEGETGSYYLVVVGGSDEQVLEMVGMAAHHCEYN